MNEKKRNAIHLHHPFLFRYLSLIPLLILVVLFLWIYSLQKAHSDLKRIGRYVRLLVNPNLRQGVLYINVSDIDTIESLAKEYNVSPESIRWANNFPEDYELIPYTVIMIPPVTGVIHEVQRDETVESIAAKYGVHPNKIWNYPHNSFSQDSAFPIVTGQILIVPDGRKDFVPLPSPAVKGVKK